MEFFRDVKKGVVGVIENGKTFLYCAVTGAFLGVSDAMAYDKTSLTKDIADVKLWFTDGEGIVWSSFVLLVAMAAYGIFRQAFPRK